MSLIQQKVLTEKWIGGAGLQNVLRDAALFIEEHNLHSKIINHVVIEDKSNEWDGNEWGITIYYMVDEER